MLAVKKSLIGNSLTIFRRTARLMGDNFEISVVGTDPVWANQRFELATNEITRVEKLLSTFSDNSIINQINRSAGIKPVKVNAEIFNLINRLLQIAELTHGVFDITYSSDKTCTRDINVATGSNTLTKIVTSCANYKKVVLNAAESTVYVNEKGLRIGFGAISKGYAADRAKYILQTEGGVSNGVINAGGDLLTWGYQPDFTPWTIATADPEQQMKPYANINISDMAIATSVNSEKYAALNNNNNISATINAKNGFVVSDITSVSILAPTAEFADAMATPVMAIGINAGLYLINQLNQIGCVIIDDHKRVYTSKDIRATE